MIDLIFALVGLLIYALSNNGKVAEIGRLVFFASVLAFLLHGAHIPRLT